MFFPGSATAVAAVANAVVPTAVVVAAGILRFIVETSLDASTVGGRVVIDRRATETLRISSRCCCYCYRAVTVAVVIEPLLWLLLWLLLSSCSSSLLLVCKSINDSLLLLHNSAV